jgi:hypothetical protein
MTRLSGTGEAGSLMGAVLDTCSACADSSSAPDDLAAAAIFAFALDWWSARGRMSDGRMSERRRNDAQIGTHSSCIRG